jgi:hypothetical protein
VSTALVPIAQCDPAFVSHVAVSREQAGARPRADFLAQLIATLAQVPQTRVRRRAEPDEAIAAYCACGWPTMAPDHAVSRSL